MIALAGTVTPLAATRSRPRAQVIASVVGLVAILAGAVVAFRSGAVTPVVAPTIALTLGALGALTVTTAAERRAHGRARRTLDRLVPAAVADALLDRGTANEALAAREMDVTVLFCDLRGFTRFAADRPAREVIGVLNGYLTSVTAAVNRQGGTVVSYLGDGVMAVFGAPLPTEDHAFRALAAAREIAGPGSTPSTREPVWHSRSGSVSTAGLLRPARSAPQTASSTPRSGTRQTSPPSCRLTPSASVARF